MKTIEMSQATSPLSEYAGAVGQGPVVITRRGKPIAAVVSLKGVDMESFAVSTNPIFIEIIERSRESLRRTGGISSDGMRRRLGLKPNRRKRSAATTGNA